MEESMAYHKKVVDEELILMNGTYMAKEQEFSTKQMAINRNRRIKAINLYICRDEKSNGFEEWDHFESVPAVGRHLCICGMLLTEHSNTVSRRNALINVKACIGDTCIQQLDKIHKTKIFKKMKDQYKTCPHCEKRKKIYEEMCKKCKLKTICKNCNQSKPVNDADNCETCNEKIKKNKFSYCVYLKTPYSDKDECKTHGGRWDQEKRKWYIPPNVDITPFKRWIDNGI